MAYIIKGVLDRFEGQQAVIKTEDDTEILWPIKKLPEDITAGNSLRISISANLDETSEKEELAKNMLNEILNVDEEPSHKQN
ncbi:MAG TPA: DUF3006 domain-containing protein [Patescibacteria group bacterium]|nr:DUF3006 domain-containing protein [Patescibacteria group bacterium]